jgi:formylglycine-generating enzyme required for sulfatase activity
MAKAEGESVMAQGAIGKLIQFLAEERDLSGTEIAETLWVALKMEPAIESVVEEPRSPASEKPVTSSITPIPSPDSEGTASVQPPPRANIATTATPQAGVLPTKALPVWIADPSMLNDPLALIRALKPLLRQVEAGPGRQLDEPATVDGIARTQLWLPVLKAETEPWFDIVLVVDRSSSMHLWQRLATDLERILRQYGAFRDLQVFDLVVDAEVKKDDAVRLKSHSERPGHHPRELIDQRGRRIVIVLSDCAATYWWDGKLLPMLQAWANVMPTVVWQMLPEWMWARTALGRGRAVALNNGIAGAENQRLRPLPLGQEDLSLAERKRVSMPVVTSDPDDLHNWSLMLSGDRQELTPGFLLPQSGGEVPKAKTFEEMAQESEAADDDAERDVQIDSLAQSRVERFLQLSSPPARRLVMLLAAAPVITLPVMRLIRDAMITDKTAKAQSPLSVAEVFLSGLLQRVPEQESNEVMTEPELVQSHANDLVQYDFVPRVRKQLLKLLPAVDTVDVVNRVTAAVEDRWNTFSTQNFRAFLLDPQAKDPEGLAGMRSFASVTAEILEALGGQYADFAKELRQGAAGEPEFEREDIDDDFSIPDLRVLDFFRAQVREETPPLQLVMDEFTVATVEIEAVAVTALADFDLDMDVTANFILEILRCISENQGNPQAIFQFLQENQAKLIPDLLTDMPIVMAQLLSHIDTARHASVVDLWHTFGYLIQQFPFASRSLKMELAITALQQVLEVRTRNQMPYEWAQTMMNLANAYADRIRGDRADNIEQAMAAYQQAMTVRTQADMPVEWATTMMNLANAYRARIRGDRADNIEQAIATSRQAMTVITQADMPVEWAATMMNLANAYADRIRGDRADNIEQAIAAYQQAMTVMTQAAMPFEWAATMMNLANAYADRIRGDRSENMETAINTYNRALEVYTREHFPEQWAMTQNSLANAYANRIRGERFENMKRSVAYCKEALGIRKTGSKPAWLIESMKNIAIAYVELLEGNQEQNIEPLLELAQAFHDDRDRLNLFSTLLPYLPNRLQAQMQKSIRELEGRVRFALVEFEFEVATLVPRERAQSARLSRRILRQNDGEWEVRRNRQTAYQFIEPLNESTRLEMVAISAGTLTMGSPESEPERYSDENPQHEVSVAAFFMGRYPVTQEQWRFVADLKQVNRPLNPDPSSFKGHNRPVEGMSWDEAVEFCDRLSQHTGNDYQLPSEAQWEYACRTGTTTPFHFGGTILPELANYDCTKVYSGGTKGEHRQETTPVDEFGIANAFGLCDMHGNVWEWCADHWHDNYEGAPTDGRAWLTDDQSANRVLHGGSWINDPRSCRSATRVNIAPSSRDDRIGFRVSCLTLRTLQPLTD